jgi:cation diffusion facilitator CzcD-associated flavoprotein CzcO
VDSEDEAAMSDTVTTLGDRPAEHHEYVVIGAGLCGLYGLYRLRELGADVLVLEAHDGVGGTWHKNRYPGCRFDSESYTYGYSFSPELLQEWNWSERFAAQPETRRYYNRVADRFQLRDNIRFHSRVESASYDEEANLWRVVLVDGAVFTCRFLVTALGLLSAPVRPRIPGIESFAGLSLHTYDWPDELDLTGKRVAVIGTGSTGVQVIASIASEVKDLTVFQMQPNWCAPLNNGPISPAEMAQIKASYDDIFAQCATTPGGFIHGPDRRPFNEVDPAERREFWEQLYAAPGFGIWLGNFRDILLDEDANEEFSQFVAEKIRSRVKDPATAEKLIPKDHGFGVQRVPMETNYYEAYNRDNVHLIDLTQTPIVEIDEDGILASDKRYDVDVIIYATGFDAITGSFDRIDIRGRGGLPLKEKWNRPGGPQTYLGVQVSDFPNFFMLGGPHSASVATNFPRAIETSVEWVTGLFEFIRDNAYNQVEADPQHEVEWTEQIKELYQRQMLRKSKSWFTGINPNVDGRDKTRYLIYTGGAPRYRKTLAEVAANGYTGFVFDADRVATASVGAEADR